MLCQRARSRLIRLHGCMVANVFWNSAQDTLKFLEHRSYRETLGGDPEFTNRIFVRARALLEDGNRPSHFSERLEIAKEDDGVGQIRSEEHTSELQSLRHLVCRLLLEKKKNKKKCNNI